MVKKDTRAVLLLRGCPIIESLLTGGKDHVAAQITWIEDFSIVIIVDIELGGITHEVILRIGIKVLVMPYVRVHYHIKAMSVPVEIL